MNSNGTPLLTCQLNERESNYAFDVTAWQLNVRNNVKSMWNKHSKKTISQSVNGMEFSKYLYLPPDQDLPPDKTVVVFFMFDLILFFIFVFGYRIISLLIFDYFIPQSVIVMSSPPGRIFACDCQVCVCCVNAANTFLDVSAFTVQSNKILTLARLTRRKGVTVLPLPVNCRCRYPIVIFENSSTLGNFKSAEQFQAFSCLVPYFTSANCCAASSVFHRLLVNTEQSKLSLSLDGLSNSERKSRHFCNERYEQLEKLSWGTQ